MFKKMFVGFLILPAILAAETADQFYFISIENQNQYENLSLQAFPGKQWGKVDDYQFLFGNELALQWLTGNNIVYQYQIFNSENFDLCVYYLKDLQSDDGDGSAIFYSNDFIITAKPIESEPPDRYLSLKSPVSNHETEPLLRIQTFLPEIDEMIDRVSQDTIMNYLTGLSGEASIEVDGHPDTIHTRFSGTEDNDMAARYLRETLENYGYQTEYHGFFSGALRNIAVSGPSLAWAVSEDSRAYRTTDGGDTWNIVPDNSSFALWGISNAGPDSVWLSGENGVIRFSSDGGATFATQTSGTTDFLFGACFINSSQGWIARDNGRVMRTLNSGQTWTAHTSPVSSRLYDVCFVDSSYGWAVGRDGVILHSANGGLNWSRQTSNTAARLYGIDFIDRDNGWAVGWSGVVRKTTDGGATWEIVDLGNAIEKYAVKFTDSMHGCIVGWDGEIFLTTNGGADWTQVISGTAKDFYGLTFMDALTGYAVGGGALFKTTDGGQTWINQAGGVEGAQKNVIATKTGLIYPMQQVIICGHFDNTSQQPTISAPGADDNGTGTTGVIEAARIFAQEDFDCTIKFCLWNGEEQGLLGSAAYAEEASFREDSIIGVFNFDMIGWDGNDDGVIELHCGTADPSIELGNIFTGVIDDYEIALSPTILTWNATDRSDHASFWDFNYPAMLGIEDFTSDFNPYYHTTNDNMSHIVADYFTLYVQGLIGATATLAAPYGTSGADDSPELPQEHIISSAYPNPFNAQAMISFTLPSDMEIELSIYDIMGRRVASLYAGLAGAGEHQVLWNANNYSSGIYFYRISTDSGQSSIGRMTLMK